MSETTELTTTPAAFLGEASSSREDEAFFHLLPIVYEVSDTFTRGTADAPSTILQASTVIETHEPKDNVFSKGVFTHPTLSCNETADNSIQKISDTVHRIYQTEKILVSIGGEHTASYGVIKGLLDAGESDFGVIHLDAHADLRDSVNGDTLHRHCVMKRIVDEDIPVFQVGQRSICEEEVGTRKVYGVKHSDADVLVPKAIGKIELPDDFPDKVYLSIDMQCFDPSVFPTSSRPLPGGLGWHQTLSIIESIAEQRDIFAFDIMEFVPCAPLPAYDLAAATLVYKVMGIVERSIDT